jgi:3-hydroxyisobutyrate dehydrogenase-like beta-hydroxyacid dehydrogenase
MQTIGFIGLGKMGGNMAASYLAAGYTVYGAARNRNAAQWLIDQGLRWVDTPREVAQAADIVMTSLPNDDVSSLSQQEPTVSSRDWANASSGPT